MHLLWSEAAQKMWASLNSVALESSGHLVVHEEGMALNGALGWEICWMLETVSAVFPFAGFFPK